MGKARQSTFSRDDMVDNEEDFEAQMAKAMAASEADERSQLHSKERGGRSRSRSRRRSPPGGSRGGAGQRRRGGRGGSRSRSPRQRSRSPPKGRGKNNDRHYDRNSSQHSYRDDQAPQSRGAVQTPQSKPGVQKAKDAVAREAEKARMKKQQREKEQQDRLAAKDKDRVQKQQEREHVLNDIANASALAVVEQSAPTAGNTDSRVSQLAMSESEQAAAAAAASREAATRNAAVAAKGALEKEVMKEVLKANGVAVETPSTDSARLEKPDEASVKKLFKILDRSDRNAVSKRDVLVALKKHAPVRVLFGLPAGSIESGADDLQQRINAIQDAFEASSGLGEVGAIFEELSKAGDSGGQNFAWEGFVVHCQQEAVRSRVNAAIGLLPREHNVGASFEATYEWQVVPEGAACVAGLEYKMDMASGRTLGRLPRKT